MDAGQTGRRGPHSLWSLAALALVGVALFAGFFALGAWQLERRAWKLELIAQTDQRIHRAPSALPAPAQWPQMDAAADEYLPVHLQGQWLADKTVLTQATTALGAGFWVLTPLQQDDNTQVLVNRGFIPQGQRAQWPERPTGATPTGPVEVVGLLRRSEPGGGFLRRNDPAQQRWHSRDVTAIAQALQLPQAAPFFVDAGLPVPQAARGGDSLPSPSAGSWPRPGLTVVHFYNHHLVYALTWFGMALLVAVAALVVARYERRLRSAAAPATPQ